MDSNILTILAHSMHKNACFEGNWSSIRFCMESGNILPCPEHANIGPYKWTGTPMFVAEVYYFVYRPSSFVELGNTWAKQHNWNFFNCYVTCSKNKTSFLTDVDGTMPRTHVQWTAIYISRKGKHKWRYLKTTKKRDWNKKSYGYRITEFTDFVHCPEF